MQITLNQEEVQAALQAHVDTLINVAGDAHITVNEDGTALVIINEEVANDDAPFETEGEAKPRQRRKRRNTAEAKHVPVEAKKELEQPAQPVQETQTSTGGQNESSTQVVNTTMVDPVEQVKQASLEVAQAEQQQAQPEVVTTQAHVEEVQQEDKAEEAKAEEAVAEEVKPAKPSLFAGLKR